MAFQLRSSPGANIRGRIESSIQVEVWLCRRTLICKVKQTSRRDFSLVVDVHAGEGGEDSRIFAAQLVSAYLRYAERVVCAAEIIYDSESSWSLRITGDRCKECFESESGKHVVQRVPEGEKNGRRHTSVVSVAVLPVECSISTSLPAAEVLITTQRGHGKGGQHQNKVESAVRATHVPTGIKVFINGRDQLRNKQLATEILEARVAQHRRQAMHDEKNRLKSAQLGYGSRSGKLRTYNFVDSTVIDHNTGIKTRKIQEVMKGHFDLLKTEK